MEDPGEFNMAPIEDLGERNLALTHTGVLNYCKQLSCQTLLLLQNSSIQALLRRAEVARLTPCLLLAKHIHLQDVKQRQLVWLKKST